MREIKFRAWDEENKVMVYNVAINDGKPIKPGYQWFSTENTVHNSRPLQFTGLLDKNGAEIYEGDVIKTRLNRIYQIVHNDGVDIGCNGGEYEYWVSGFVPAAIDGVIDNSGESEFGYDQFVTGECEVIGNIYEHPHLLSGDSP